MSPVPVATQMPVSTGSTNTSSGLSCSSSFINHTNFDHLDLLNSPHEFKNLNENSLFNNSRHGVGGDMSGDMGCFDGGSMLFSPNYNSSSSNSSMMSNESASINSNNNNNNNGINFTNASHKTETDLFDSFSLDKFSNTFSTNSFFDVDLFQYGDSYANFSNLNGMGTNFANDFLAFDDEDDESDSLDDDDLIIPHVLDQELTRAISDNIDEEDSESDNLVNEHQLDSIAVVNNEALCAIREIAIREKRQQQRKHKNSTSSISSMSMSSTIKKVAIELQNTANMASSGLNTNSSGNSNNNAGFNFANSMNHFIDFNAKIDHVLDNDENLDDNNDFIDLLGLEDWEKMLDEDCISRLTADFNNNILNMNTSASPNKQLTSTPINPTNANIIQPTSDVSDTQEKASVLSTTTTTVIPKIQYITSTKSQTTTNNSQPLVLRVPQQQHQQQSSLNQSCNNISNANVNIKKINIQAENTNSSLNIITNTKPNLPSTIIANAATNVVRRLSSVMLNENKNNIKNNGKNHGTSTTSVTATKSSQSLTSVICKKNTDINKPVPIIKIEPVTNTNLNLTENSSNFSSTTSTISPSSIVTSPSGSTTSSSSSSTSTSVSLIDHTEIIDCVNPDQIFPYRFPLHRLIKNESSNNRGTIEDDEDEEEIDVVSVNNHYVSSLQQQNQQLNSYNELKSNLSQSKKLQTKQTKHSLIRNVNSENITNLLPVSNGSLLAKCLKSSPLNNSSKINNNLLAASTQHQTTVVTKTTSSSLSDTNETSLTTAKKSSNFIKTTKINNNNNNGSNGLNQSLHLNKSKNDQTTTKVGTRKPYGSNRKNGANKCNKNVILPGASSTVLTTATQSNSNTNLEYVKILTTTPLSINNSTNSVTKCSSLKPSITLACTTSANVNTNNTSTNKTVTLTPTIKLRATNSTYVLNNTISDQLNTKYITMTTTKVSPNNIKNINSCATTTTTTTTTTSSCPTSTTNSQMGLKSTKIISTTPCTNMNNTSTTTIISQNNNSLNTTAVSNSFKLQQNLKTITTSTNASNLGCVDNVTPKWTTQQTTSTNPKVLVASSSPNSNFQMSNANDSTMLITTTVNNKMTKKLHKLTNNPMMNATLDTSSLNKSINNNEFHFLEDDDLARRKFLIKNSQLILNNIKNEINSNRSNYDEADLDEMNDDLDEGEDIYDIEDEDEFDDDEDDDEEDDDDDDDDDCSISASSTGGSPSHFLTSSPTSFSSMSSSSGCSTPTKSSKVAGKLGKSEVDVLNEKLGKKQTKKQKKLQMLQQQQLTASGDSSQFTSTASATTGSGSKRNSRLQTMGYSSDNPAEKRAFHILSERQRRNDLKKLFETLRTSIPVLCDKAKASKLTILKAAVEHLVETTNKSEKQKAILDKEKQRQAQLMLNLKLLQQEHFGVNYHQQQQNHHQILNPTNINTNNTNNLATLLVH